jgi:hypothetical protein
MLWHRFPPIVDNALLPIVDVLFAVGLPSSGDVVTLPKDIKTEVLERY